MGEIILNTFKFIGFLMVFGSILFLIVISTRFIGNKAKIAMKGKIINVVESVSLGFDKQLHLVKVGDQYVLIASCGKSLEFLTNITTEVPEQNIDVSEGPPTFDFKTFFEKYLTSIKVSKNKKDETLSEENLLQKQKPEIFRSNLGRLKTITNRTGTYDKNDGDDTADEE